MSKIKNVFELTYDEIESCIDGSSNVEMIKEILTQEDVVGEDGFVDPEVFADYFAQEISGFINAEMNSDEWIDANDSNWTWGYDIGDNINSLISDNFKNNSFKDNHEQ